MIGRRSDNNSVVFLTKKSDYCRNLFVVVLVRAHYFLVSLTIYFSVLTFSPVTTFLITCINVVVEWGENEFPWIKTDLAILKCFRTVPLSTTDGLNMPSSIEMYGIKLERR